MKGRLEKFIGFAIFSVLAVTLAFFLLLQALTFNAKTPFLGTPFEIIVIIIGIAILGLSDN